MFTFGRDREQEAAAGYVRNPEQVPLVHALVDRVHDLLEGRGAVEAVVQSLDHAFIDGTIPDRG